MKKLMDLRLETLDENIFELKMEIHAMINLMNDELSRTKYDVDKFDIYTRYQDVIQHYMDRMKELEHDRDVEHNLMNWMVRNETL